MFEKVRGQRPRADTRFYAELDRGPDASGEGGRPSKWNFEGSFVLGPTGARCQSGRFRPATRAPNDPGR